MLDEGLREAGPLKKKRGAPGVSFPGRAWRHEFEPRRSRRRVPPRVRARLDRLSGELKGRAAPRPASEAPPTPKTDASATSSAMSLGLRAGQRVCLGGDPRLRHRLGSRPRAPHQSCLSHCVFLDWRRGGDLERDPADFAKTVSLTRNSPLSRANSPDKDVRRSASGSRTRRLVGGARSRRRGGLRPRNEADDDED